MSQALQTPFSVFSSLLFILTSNILIITQALPVDETRSVLSFPLRCRDPFMYTSDTARVNYLNSRLEKALSNFPANEIQGGALTPQGDLYVADIALGPRPSVEMDLVVDTGSEITWVKCSPCDQCTGHVYNTSKSSTYRTISCLSPQCVKSWFGITCEDMYSTCSFHSYYGDGSVTGGEIGAEMVSFWGSTLVNDVVIGCAHEVGGNIRSIDGILGLGPDPISFPNQLKATLFSYCLNRVSSISNSETSSSLDFNAAAPADSVVVGMGRNQKSDIYYYVNLTGITIGEDHIVVPPEVYEIRADGRGGVVIDSGTALTHLDSRVYGSFLDAFKKNAQNLTLAQGSDKCYDIPGVSSPSDIQFPAMSFQFLEGKSLLLGPKNIFQKKDESIYCLAFESASQILSIIGNIAQQGMRVTYDLGNKLIAFSPNKC